MITLLELYYNIQKDLFFADKIVKDTYTIYHSNNIKSTYCNYAVLSNLISARKLYNEISDEFSKLGRKPCIYINANQINDLSDLQDYKIQVRYIENWLRYDGKEMEKFHKVKALDPSDYNNYFKLLNDIESKFEFKKEPEYKQAVKNSLNSQKYQHYIAYDGKEPVAIASIGSYNGYAMIYNLFTKPDYRGKGYTQSILQTCVDEFRKAEGKEIYILLPSDSYMEKWYTRNGFKKIYTGYGMSL